jgi:biopolymer transport protein ExbD
MAIQSQSDNEDVVGDINVTPLVDVMMVLLVIFIVTAPLLSNAIKVNLPQSHATPPADPRPPTSLSVDAQGKIYLDHVPIELPALEDRLTALHRADPEVSVHLNADQDANYGVVAKTMSAVDRAGITKLSVLAAGE